MAVGTRRRARRLSESVVSIPKVAAEPDTSGSVTVDLAEPAPDIGGATISEQDDGSAVVELLPAGPAGALPTGNFADNLVGRLSEDDRNTLAETLLQEVQADLDSRADYEKAYTYGMKLLGLTIEKRTKPFVGASGVFDPLLAEAVVRFQANAMGELLPAAGPVKTKLIGNSTPEKEEQAIRVRTWMNYYFTELAPEYYPDFDQMLMWLPMCGSVFRKVYFDPALMRPVSSYITPDHFIVNYSTRSLQACKRMTHIIPMSGREMIWNQLTKFYDKVDLGPPTSPDNTPLTETQKAVDTVQGTKPVRAPVGDEEYQVYEIHTFRHFKEFPHEHTDPVTGVKAPTELPIPYIITIEKESRKVLAVRRNYVEGDPLYKPRQYFVQYKFLPGFGFYGLGLSHLLGGYAKAATSILRQLIDAGTMSIFPGGVRIRGMRVKDNTIRIGPSEFPEIDTGGMSIQQALLPLPSKEPSIVSMQTRTEMVESARRLGSTSDIAVGDGRQDAPVGTTVALLDKATKVESGVIKRQRRTQALEFKMIAELFKQTLPKDKPYPFLVEGGEKTIIAADFDDRIDVVPTGDPNVASGTERLVRAETTLRLAQSAPNLHNMRNAFERFYTAMGVEDVHALLPPQEEVRPADPITENQRAMMGLPLKVGIWQDDNAHIQAHMPLAMTPGMQGHIAEHAANKYRKQIETALGIALPPMGEPMPPEIENEIARLVAQATDTLEKMNPDSQLSPGMLALEDIKQRAREADLRHKAAMAAIDQKAADSYQDYLSSQAKNQTTLKVAKMKSYTDLAKDRSNQATKRSIGQQKSNSKGGS